MTSGFSLFDTIIVIVYLIGGMLFGLRLSGKQSSSSDYFLGGRSIPWWAVLFSVVATETSTLTFISIPAVAYGGTLVFLQLTLGYLLGRILVALFFLPGYFNGQLTTAYHFLEERFGLSLRRAASSTFIVTRLLADGVRLFAAAIPITVIFRFAGVLDGFSDLQLYMISIGLITLITGIYTWFGGIRAVIWMDVLQMGLYLFGAGMAMVLLLKALPQGMGELIGDWTAAGKLELLRFSVISSGDGGFGAGFFSDAYLFWVAVIGGAIFSIASHGTDQLIVQRLLTTSSLRESQKALIFSGVLAMMQFAFFLFIGLLLWSFYGGATPEQLGISNLDEVFITYVVSQMPSGMPGLIVAALLAAAMSSLSSSLSALSSSTTFDLIKPLWSGAAQWSDEKELAVSRQVSLSWAVVLALSAIGFAWLQLSSDQRPAVVELGLSIASYTYGGLLGLFFLGRFFPRPEAKDALIGFFVALGTLLLLVDGPIRRALPEWIPFHELTIAWPLYTVVGSVIVMLVGAVSYRIRK